MSSVDDWLSLLISMVSRTLLLNQPSSPVNTSTLFLLMTWPCSRQWHRIAVGWVLWLVWSFILVARVLPVSPAYICWHCGLVTWYTIPHFYRSGFFLWDVPTKTALSLWGGGTRPHRAHGKFLPVFLKFHGCQVAYARFARFGLAMSLGLAQRISIAHFSYWFVLSARFTWATRDLSSGFVTRTSALFRSVRTTERLCSMWWLDLKFRYWSVWVGFLYTVTWVLSSSFMCTQVSKKGRTSYHCFLTQLWK